MHSIHMGSQIVAIVLDGHESVSPSPGPVRRAQANLFFHSQPILADEVQTFKALQTIHKVLQEGHPIAVREAQANTGWLESLARGVSGEGMRGNIRVGKTYRDTVG